MADTYKNPVGLLHLVRPTVSAYRCLQDTRFGILLLGPYVRPLRKTQPPALAGGAASVSHTVIERITEIQKYMRNTTRVDVPVPGTLARILCVARALVGAGPVDREAPQEGSARRGAHVEGKGKGEVRGGEGEGGRLDDVVGAVAAGAGGAVDLFGALCMALGGVWDLPIQGQGDGEAGTGDAGGVPRAGRAVQELRGAL